MPGPSSRTQRGREFGLASAPWFHPPFQGSTLFNPYLGFPPSAPPQAGFRRRFAAPLALFGPEQTRPPFSCQWQSDGLLLL